MRTSLLLCGLLAGAASMTYGADAPGAAAGQDNEGIVIWGHSFPADITPARLAAGLQKVGAKRPDRPIVNQSIGGHGLDQSLMRMGAYPLTVEVMGGTIPATGRVKLINPRSPAMANQFDAGLGPIVAKYGSPLRVQLAADSEVMLTLANRGEEFADAILKKIRWPGISPDDDPSRARFQTWVEIGGVIGQIGLEGKDKGKGKDKDKDKDKGKEPEDLFFQRREAGEAVKVDGPAEVKMLAVGPNMQHDVEKLNRWLKIVWTPGPGTVPWPEIYGRSAWKQSECEASMDIGRLRMRIFVESALRCMEASNKRLILLIGSQGTAAPSDHKDTLKGRFANELARSFYKDNYPDYFFDFVAASLTGLGSVPPAKEWFMRTHPELFRDPNWGWGAELHTIPNGPHAGGYHSGREKAAVAEIRVTGNGGRGVKGAQRVGTETPGANRCLKTGLFVGVEAENGVAVQLTVREGGRGYVAGDRVTIPAGAVGNADPITAEVAAIREETIGTVRHPDGTVDIEHSYSQWDVDNGYWPRCFRRDGGHFSHPAGGEYLSLLVAAFIKEKGW
jgi:hypothetical protein